MFGWNTKYQYMSSQTAIDFTPEDTKLDSKELCKLITLNLGEPLVALEKLAQVARGGHWEVISHDLLLLGNHLIVSFLLRRPQQKNK